MGDKSPSILLGRSFQVLVSETSVPGISREADGKTVGARSGIGFCAGLTIRCSSSHATKHYKIQVTLR